MSTSGTFNDEFFAGKENLLKPGREIFREDGYGRVSRFRVFGRTAGEGP
jgi:allantoicase